MQTQYSKLLPTLNWSKYKENTKILLTYKRKQNSNNRNTYHNRKKNIPDLFWRDHHGSYSTYFMKTHHAITK